MGVIAPFPPTNLLANCAQNIEVFFCLYASHWNSPAQCNSSHSRLLGFLSCLPGIWRAFQCIRRYYDTRNIFPHLVNCGKYTCTILFYTSLSIYRIDKNPTHRAVFITLATINSLYCSVWDLAMDWSLCNPYAKYPFLRDTLGYKRAWYYYVAMIIDPILRFNWIFYAIFAHDLQHSAILSFLVSLSEIFRRGMWSLFRVENEHCTNVGRFRAFRDIPLPYDLPSSSKTSLEQPTSPDMGKKDKDKPHLPEIRTPEDGRTHASGADIESAAAAATTPTAGSPLRLRRTRTHAPTTPVQRGISRVGTLMAAAHAQDFERKRRPDTVGAEASPHFGGSSKHHDSSDEEDDGDDDDDDGDDGQDLIDAERLIEIEGARGTGSLGKRRSGS
jgi:xenotropic and polytropic retrovirus receptor 1